MDYDVFYKGKIIGNIQAENDFEALKLAIAIYGDEVLVELV